MAHSNDNLVRKYRGLILGLGAFALIRPLFSMVGLMEVIGQPFGSLSITIVVTAIWVIVAVVKKVENPVLVLMCAGICYAVFAMLLSGILSPILTGSFQGPLTNPFAIISMLITNIVWGLIAGVIAVAVKKMIRL